MNEAGFDVGVEIWFYQILFRAAGPPFLTTFHYARIRKASIQRSLFPIEYVRIRNIYILEV